MQWRLAVSTHGLQQCCHVRVVKARLTSTSTGPTRFPYPLHPRPTPHQIFHLPPNASRQDIKARYYDLVRVHHPDSPLCSDLSHSERQSRFQAITAAYDTLRGVIPHDAFAAEIRRRKHTWGAASHDRVRHRRSGGHHKYDFSGGWNDGSDDRWKDTIIVLAGMFTLAAGIGPGLFVFASKDGSHQRASANLAKARREAQEFGEHRRKAIRLFANSKKS